MKTPRIPHKGVRRGATLQYEFIRRTFRWCCRLRSYTIRWRAASAGRAEGRIIQTRSGDSGRRTGSVCGVRWWVRGRRDTSGRHSKYVSSKWPRLPCRVSCMQRSSIASGASVCHRRWSEGAERTSRHRCVVARTQRRRQHARSQPTGAPGTVRLHRTTRTRWENQRETGVKQGKRLWIRASFEYDAWLDCRLRSGEGHLGKVRLGDFAWSCDWHWHCFPLGLARLR